MEASSHGTDDCSRRASDILALMEKFQTYFGLTLSILIFSLTEQLSVTLHGVKTNANDCLVAVHATIQGVNTNANDCLVAVHATIQGVNTNANDCLVVVKVTIQG